MVDLQRQKEKFFIEAGRANTYYIQCLQGPAPVARSRVMKDVLGVERKPVDNWYLGRGRGEDI